MWPPHTFSASQAFLVSALPKIQSQIFRGFIALLPGKKLELFLPHMWLKLVCSVVQHLTFRGAPIITEVGCKTLCSNMTWSFYILTCKLPPSRCKADRLPGWGRVVEGRAGVPGTETGRQGSWDREPEPQQHRRHHVRAVRYGRHKQDDQ